MSTSRQVRTRPLLFTLFGDYIFPREGWAWTESLLHILKLLGVSNPAARSTLSRLTRQGWLRAQRRGRHSFYALTLKARHLLEEGTHRIFEPRPKQWDGQWRVVVYSLPEKKRHLREALRRRLSFLGFGALAPGTWISPHDRQAEIDALVNDLNVRPYVQYFEGRWKGGLSNEELVARCWDLKSLSRQYAIFLKKWRPEFDRLTQRSSSNGDMKADHAFAQRFWIIHEYGAFPSRDPHLPDALLPNGWNGDDAAQLFRDYRGRLTQAADAFIDDTLKSEGGRHHQGPGKSSPRRRI